MRAMRASIVTVAILASTIAGADSLFSDGFESGTFGGWAPAPRAVLSATWISADSHIEPVAGCDADGWFMTTDVRVIADAGIAPDGSATADRVTATTGSLYNPNLYQPDWGYYTVWLKSATGIDQEVILSDPANHLTAARVLVRPFWRRFSVMVFGADPPDFGGPRIESGGQMDVLIWGSGRDPYDRVEAIHMRWAIMRAWHCGFELQYRYVHRVVDPPSQWITHATLPAETTVAVWGSAPGADIPPIPVPVTAGAYAKKLYDWRLVAACRCGALEIAGPLTMP